MVIFSILASLLLSVSPTLGRDTAIRVYNPHTQPVVASFACDVRTRTLHIAAGEVADLAPGSLCESAVLDAPLPLLAFEVSSDGDRDVQSLLGADAECGTASMAVPLFACKSGVATASVPPVAGAAYLWTAEGATITSGGETNRVVVQLGQEPVARLTCVITTSECTTTASGVISVREPIVIRELAVPPSSNATVPVTISWSYLPGREPAAQLLSGTAFPAPVPLGADARSHTFTPQSGDARSVELRATYARAVPTGVRSRRRAVGGGVLASECPSALATARIDVRGCSANELVLDAPEDVAAGAAFVARLDIEDGEKVEWSVENGTVQSASPFGESVMVVAGTTGKVNVSALIERKPGCFASAAASVSIILPLSQCAIVPTASIALVAHDCDSATVQATFTGTPPFAGEWSDGTPFRVTRNTVSHEFRTAGAYGLTEFRDSSCFGVVTGSPSLTQLRPDVTLQVASASCGTARLVATFVGVPPFIGEWSDGQPFTTSESRLERTVSSGPWSVRNLNDAACRSARAKSAIVSVAPPPTATLTKAGPVCQSRWEQTTPIYIDVLGGQPPYVAEWTDGATHSSTSSHFARAIPVMTPPASKDFALKRVTAAGCEATLIQSDFTLLSRGEPEVDYSGPNTTCVGTSFTVPLRYQPSPGGTINWQFMGDVKVLSGQGTPTVTFSASVPMWTYLTMATTYPDGFCSTVTHWLKYTWVSPGSIGDIVVSPTTIARGGLVGLLWKVAGTPSSYSVTAPYPRNFDLHKDGCCSATYRDTQGPGAVPITFSWTDPCTGPHTETRTITILP